MKRKNVDLNKVVEGRSCSSTVLLAESGERVHKDTEQGWTVAVPERLSFLGSAVIKDGRAELF